MKLVFIGDPGVGKTCFLERLANQEFTEKYTPTIGMQVYIRTINNVKCQFTDTSGQERFRQFISGYTEKADVIVFVYDMTNYDSFKSIKETWMPLCHQKTLEQCTVMYLGTKHDLANHFENKDQEYIATSAKTNYLIDEAVAILCKLGRAKRNEFEQESEDAYDDDDIFIPSSSSRRLLCCFE
jgi:small GTP-binding protein